MRQGEISDGLVYRRQNLDENDCRVFASGVAARSGVDRAIGRELNDVRKKFT